MSVEVQKNIAEFIVNTRYGQVEPRFIKDIKYRIIDWLGCATAGAHYKQAEIARTYWETIGGVQEATAIGAQAKYPAPNAAFINGIIGHVSELDDGHRLAIGHPGSVTLPVALAIGENVQASGQEFLTALIIGYEIYIRLGSAVNPSHYKYWHTTSTCGIFAATGVAASLLKLTVEETINALGIAGTMASGFSESFGSHAKALNIAHACQNGIMSARLAKLGFTGSPTILTGKKGFLAATSSPANWPKMAEFNSATLISDTAFYKVYASCGHTNSPLDIIFQLLTKGPISTEKIKTILVETYKVSVDIAKDLKTATEDAAKFSLPYVIAVALLKKHVTLGEFTPEMLHDETMLSLARKVKVVEDAEATKRFPKRQAKITIVMEDGTKLCGSVDDSHDVTDYPKLEEKFRGLTAKVADDAAEKVLASIKHLDESNDIKTLINYLQVI